jgi:transposase InsO family protein
VYKWLRRFDEEGEKGLEDRSSRPHHTVRCTSVRQLQRIERLRRRKRTAYEISQETGIPTSTISLRLQELGLGRIWQVEQAEAPPQRYEHRRPGDLFHIDAKRLGRIGCVGHAIHGDYTRRARGIGWEAVFVCVDDHTRLAYAEVLPSENAKYATAFLRRALRWFASLGIRCRRLMSDNAKCYSSGAFTDLCEKNQIRQVFTRPYTPKTKPTGTPTRPQRCGPTPSDRGSSTTITSDPIEASAIDRP